MSNCVILDVRTSILQEINQIERALQEPCDELLARCAQRSGADPMVVVANIKEIVSFESVCNLDFDMPLVNTARRFRNSWTDQSWDLVWTHVNSVSGNFPRAVFLAEYWNDQASSVGKRVFHAGNEIRCTHDVNHDVQAREWRLLNIFAPYRAEYELGLECGSLWDEWMEGMRCHLDLLTERYSGSRGLKLDQADASGKEK